MRERTTSMIWRSLRRFGRNQEDGIRAVAAIEFAVIAPVLVLMLITTLDLGVGIYRKMQVQNAAQAGAQYAMAHGFAASEIATAVTSATTNSAIAASPAPMQLCGCPSSTGIAEAACSSTCSGGSHAGTYVRVSAQTSYITVLPYPLLPDRFTFSAQATVRIK